MPTGRAGVRLRLAKVLWLASERLASGIADGFDTGAYVVRYQTTTGRATYGRGTLELVGPDSSVAYGGALCRVMCAVDTSRYMYLSASKQRGSISLGCLQFRKLN